MRKRFNVTGSCNPEQHYMVDTAKRFAAVEELIDFGEYFTINRARQFGKTTMLDMIWRKLSGSYIVISLSFEGVADEMFESHATFAKMFAKKMTDRMERIQPGGALTNVWKNATPANLYDLSAVITQFTTQCPKPVVLTIDEVDKSSDNQLFLSFLGMLRNKYLQRNVDGMNSTFHSVILAGVYDVKNLKLKLRPDEEKKYNSPWNIAADFHVDMTFHPEEIARMLGDYEQDAHTGMDIKAISEEIYRYTSGYPVLVSYVCKLIDERLDQQWDLEHVQAAVKIIAKGENVTLIDDLSKNLENYSQLRELLYSIAVNGAEYSYSMVDANIRFANMFAYIRENARGKAMIHNLIFEEALFVYFGNQYMTENSTKLSPFILNYVHDGKLDMEHIVTRFRDLLREEYRKEDEAFLERQGRLIFLSFLKPIINGVGFYYVEPQTRDNRRMDLVVTYGKEEFVVELKIWRGDKYEQKGREQLSEYLSVRGKDEGYLVTFDLTKNKAVKGPEWVEVNGKRIFEVTI